MSVIDQVALFKAEVGIKESDPFSVKHMHIAVRLEELLELEERGYVLGVQIDLSLSPDQILQKRGLGPVLFEQLRSGEVELFGEDNGKRLFVSSAEPEASLEESDEPWPPRRSAERVAMYDGTVVKLTAEARSEVERIGRNVLDIPPSLQGRIAVLLAEGLFDTAIRDLGAALETRMRLITHTDSYGANLVREYIDTLLQSGQYYQARVKSLGQELRSVFKFIRNEFAHQIVSLEPSRGYALVSRLCWHVTDVEGMIEDRNS